MKRAKMKTEVEFYRSGKWSIMVTSSPDKFHKAGTLYEFYIKRESYANWHHCFGWPSEQPTARDGHTHWTHEEVLELFEENLPDEKVMANNYDEFEEFCFNNYWDSWFDLYGHHTNGGCPACGE